jgi:hypothetical protein
MKNRFPGYLGFLLCGFLAFSALVRTDAHPQPGSSAAQAGASGVQVGSKDIGGVVTSHKGPEAGVWVIAETTQLPTAFRKIVVTDDHGRYLLPELPDVTYKVWVRGYGLVDSRPVESRPGKTLNLNAVLASNPQAAAQYYPSNYWYSLIKVPPKNDFPGTGPQGNGISPDMLTQDHWINVMKTGCETCHQIGDKATRELEPSLGAFESHELAWDYRVGTGQDSGAGPADDGMSARLSGLGRGRALKMFADWTRRVAAGDVPEAPPRPEGIERNLVVTMWDWGGPATFVHDELSTNKLNPTANANGPIYGVDWGNDLFLTFDPATNTSSSVRIPVSGPDVPAAKPQTMLNPSPYWGDELYWTDPANPNHLQMDKKGRLWIAARFRKPEAEPAFCKDHPSAGLSPLTKSFRQVIIYDPKTKAFTDVDTCFDTHHAQLASDPDETVYFNGIRDSVIGWVKTRVWDETGGNAALSQGWCKGFLDTKGDGKVDPAVDLQVKMDRIYGIAWNPADGSVWGAVPAPMPGRIMRLDPKTCLAEAYEPPFNNPAVPDVNGYTPRGIDVDTNGVVWTALAASGHLASFDRRKCKVLNGPTATGQHCPEGWTLYPTPGPVFKGTNIRVDYHYYNFVDRYNTLGLGKDVPLVNGTGSDSLIAFDPHSKKFITMRVPYPLGFFTRGMDGRIDDPNGGWKGHAMYADYGPNTNWHIEGGKGTTSKLVKFQIRPSPLAN